MPHNVTHTSEIIPLLSNTEERNHTFLNPHAKIIFYPILISLTAAGIVATLGFFFSKSLLNIILISMKRKGAIPTALLDNSGTILINFYFHVTYRFSNILTRCFYKKHQTPITEYQTIQKEALNCLTTILLLGLFTSIMVDFFFDKQVLLNSSVFIFLAASVSKFLIDATLAYQKTIQHNQEINILIDELNHRIRLHPEI